RAEEEPPLAALSVLELTRAERDEVDRERMPFVPHDRGRQGEAQSIALASGGLLLLPLVAFGLDGLDRGLLFLQDAVEEVDNPLGIQQGIEAVVGAQLEQLAELA